MEPKKSGAYLLDASALDDSTKAQMGLKDSDRKQNQSDVDNLGFSDKLVTKKFGLCLAELFRI